jgi:hypothetical protein
LSRITVSANVAGNFDVMDDVVHHGTPPKVKRTAVLTGIAAQVSRSHDQHPVFFRTLYFTSTRRVEFLVEWSCHSHRYSLSINFDNFADAISTGKQSSVHKHLISLSVRELAFTKPTGAASKIARLTCRIVLWPNVMAQLYNNMPNRQALETAIK